MTDRAAAALREMVAALDARERVLGKKPLPDRRREELLGPFAVPADRPFGQATRSSTNHLTFSAWRLLTRPRRMDGRLPSERAN